MSKKSEKLKKYGHSRNVALILFSRQRQKCYYCKTSLLEEAKAGRVPHIDHRVPKSLGGQRSEGWTNLSNLCLTCEWCDSIKNNLTDKDFSEFIEPHKKGKIAKKDLSEYWLYKKLGSEKVSGTI